MKQIIEDARGLSGGTIASLIDCPRYDVIDNVQNKFVEFCRLADSRGESYDTWVEAWNDFSPVLFKLDRNGETTYYADLPTVRGKLDYRLYEFNRYDKDWIQIEGRL